MWSRIFLNVLCPVFLCRRNIKDTKVLYEQFLSNQGHLLTLVSHNGSTCCFRGGHRGCELRLRTKDWRHVWVRHGLKLPTRTVDTLWQTYLCNIIRCQSSQAAVTSTVILDPWRKCSSISRRARPLSCRTFLWSPIPIWVPLDNMHENRDHPELTVNHASPCILSPVTVMSCSFAMEDQKERESDCKENWFLRANTAVGDSGLSSEGLATCSSSNM